MLSLNGIFFRDFSNSYIPQILQEIYIKRVYQPFVEGRRDMVIADWGGNIGLTSFYFKDYASMVYCVEPAKEHQEVIKYMLDYNRINNVRLCPYAIAGQNGTTKFYHNKNTTMYSMESVVNDKNDFEEVETVDTQTFMKREGIDHIDLLKWDTEGSEGQILASPSFQKMCPKIKVICGEWHQWASMSQDLFMNTFRDLGYEFRWRKDTDASVFEAVRV